MKYQVVVMGPSKEQFHGVLITELEGRIADLGLDKTKDFEVIQAKESSRIDWEGTPVGVWFGGVAGLDQHDVDVLQQMLKENCSVFPVVEDLHHYGELVPSDLHRINGHLWNKMDQNNDTEGCLRLVTNILQVFRLTRPQRQAFISYRRSDTRGVAVQLFDELSQRGYRPFLDTWSVESGVDFQQALFGRMADVDLLIFLDSPNALTSRWVHHELARANDLGLGAVQLVWPNHQRTAGTEFSDWIQLQLSDFHRQTADPEDMLTTQAVATVVSLTERARIRSLKARRARVVADLVDRAKEAGMEAVVPPVGVITLYRANTAVGKVIPFVGIPDAYTIEQEQKSLQDSPASSARIVYSGLGMNSDWADHLEWLNTHADFLMTAQIDLIDDWLGGLR